MNHASPVRTPFDWLLDPEDRGSALRQIESALGRGWLDPSAPDVAPLRAILAELVEDPTTTAAQRRRVLRLLGLLEGWSDQPGDAARRSPRPAAQLAVPHEV